MAPRLSTCSLTAGRTSKADTTAPRRRAVAIGLQPRHARAEHEHLRRRDRARRRHQQREEAGQAVRRHERRLVAGDGALGREHVHALRARDARDRLEREPDDAALGQPLDALAVGERLQERDQHRALAQRVDLGAGRLAHLDDDLGGGRVREALDELGARLLVGAVREAGRGAGAALDEHVEAAPASLRTPSGASPTRRSSAAVSRGTPTRTGGL